MLIFCQYNTECEIGCGKQAICEHISMIYKCLYSKSVNPILKIHPWKTKYRYKHLCIKILVKIIFKIEEK